MTRVAIQSTKLILRSAMATAVVASIALIVAGCKPAREPAGIVAGRVVNQDKPVTDANIYFEKVDDDYAVFASLQVDGSFKLKTHDYGGLPAGSYRIAVRPDPGKVVILAGDDKPQLSHPLIPSQFMDANTSGLTADVKSGENPAFHFDLGK